MREPSSQSLYQARFDVTRVLFGLRKLVLLSFYSNAPPSERYRSKKKIAWYTSTFTTSPP